MFVTEARAQCYELFYVHNLRIFILSQNVCQTKLEKLARDKRSCLLQKLVNYVHKKFCNIGPRAYLCGAA